MALEKFRLSLLAATLLGGGCEASKPREATQDFRAPSEKSTQKRRSFPECGQGVYAELPDWSRVWLVDATFTPTTKECVHDRMKNRDCANIRAEARSRIADIPGMFACEPGALGRLMLRVPPEALLEFGDLDEVSGTKGDCEEVMRDFEARILEVMKRMACDDKGQPHEKLGFGQAPGGWWYNPCVGGHC